MCLFLNSNDLVTSSTHPGYTWALLLVVIDNLKQLWLSKLSWSLLDLQCIFIYLQKTI